MKKVSLQIYRVTNYDAKIYIYLSSVHQDDEPVVNSDDDIT